MKKIYFSIIPIFILALVFSFSPFKAKALVSESGTILPSCQKIIPNFPFTVSVNAIEGYQYEAKIVGIAPFVQEVVILPTSTSNGIYIYTILADTLSAGKYNVIITATPQNNMPPLTKTNCIIVEEPAIPSTPALEEKLEELIGFANPVNIIMNQLAYDTYFASQKKIGTKSPTPEKQEEINIAINNVLSFLGKELGEMARPAASDDYQEIVKAQELEVELEVKILQQLRNNEIPKFMIKDNTLYVVPPVLVVLAVTEVKEVLAKTTFGRFFNVFATLFEKKKEVKKAPEVPQPQVVANLTEDQIIQVQDLLNLFKEAKEKGVLSPNGLQQIIAVMQEQEKVSEQKIEANIYSIIALLLQQISSFNYMLDVNYTSQKVMWSVFGLWNQKPNWDLKNPEFEAAIEEALNNYLEAPEIISP